MAACVYSAQEHYNMYSTGVGQLLKTASLHVY